MPTVSGEVVEQDSVEEITREMLQSTIEQTGQQNTYTQLDGRLARFTSFASYKTYRAMRRDPTIWIARQLATAPAISAPWSVESRDYAPSGASDLIAETFLPLRIDFLMHSILGNADYGWQGFENVSGVDFQGRVRTAKLKPLLHDMTEILICPKTGAFDGYVQDTVFGEEQRLYAPQVFHTVLNYEGTDWYGEPDMEAARKAYDDWNTVNRAAERYDRKIAGSHWVVHFPNGVSLVNGVETDNLIVAKGIINTLQASGAVAIPSTLSEFTAELSKDSKEAWRIELLSDQNGSKAAFIDRMKYLDALKARAFCLPERAIQEGTFGTKAEAEAHANMALTLCERKHRQLVTCLNNGPVQNMMRVNYGKAFADSVYLEPAPIVDEFRTILVELYKIILQNPDALMSELHRIDLEQLADRLNLPVKPVDKDIDLTEPAPVVDPMTMYIPPQEGDATYDDIAASFDDENKFEMLLLSYAEELVLYNENQPRGPDGRWVSSPGPTTISAYKAAQKAHKANQKALERAKETGDPAKINKAQMAFDKSKAEQVTTGRAYRAYLKASKAADAAQAAVEEQIAEHGSRLADAWSRMDAAADSGDDAAFDRALADANRSASAIGGVDTPAYRELSQSYLAMQRAVEQETRAAQETIDAIGVPAAVQEEQTAQAIENTRVPVERGVKQELLDAAANIKHVKFGRQKKDEWGTIVQEHTLANGQKYTSGQSVLEFETTGGSKYRITGMHSTDHVGGGRSIDIVFSDEAGSYQVTGKQGAKGAIEVFNKVGAATLALAKEHNPSSLTFSAAAPFEYVRDEKGEVKVDADGNAMRERNYSRQKLYDRLSKTFAKANPDYAVYAVVNDDGYKGYHIVKRDLVEESKEKVNNFGYSSARVEDIVLSDSDYVWMSLYYA